MATKKKKNRRQMKRAFVSLPDGVWESIHHSLKGRLGEGDSEIIRNIVISYLSEAGYFISDSAKNDVKRVDAKVTVLGHMLASLIEALAEKGIVTVSDVDKRIKKKIDSHS